MAPADPNDKSFQSIWGESRYYLKRLVPARVVLLVFLLLLYLYVYYNHQGNLGSFNLFSLSLLVALTVVLSLFSLFLSKKLSPKFAIDLQLGLDTIIVTLIVFISGGFYSLFSFLYLLVIIYASMLRFMFGGFLVATLSTIQFAVLVVCQFKGIFIPILGDDVAILSANGWTPVVHKIAITSAGCFAVAFLSGLLTEQNRKSQKELQNLEAHLKRVEKMAYMGEMAAGLAHEIKNPLASLVGSIQMLKEEFHYDADHQRLMEIILRETDRLGILVNDFLFFARPPAGKPVKLSLKVALEEIAVLFESDINHSRHFTLIKKNIYPLWVVMDPTHLRQVLWNLLLNAAEALNEGGIIEIEALKLKNNEAVIRIKDNGGGMPTAVARSIFDPFFTTKSEGTGLGLSIVHRILEAYGTRLDVESVENGGTTVSFVLKRITPPD